MVFETYKELQRKQDPSGYKDLLTMSRMSSSIYKDTTSRFNVDESSVALPKQTSSLTNLTQDVDDPKPDLSRKWSRKGNIYEDESVASTV